MTYARDQRRLSVYPTEIQLRDAWTFRGYSFGVLRMPKRQSTPEPTKETPDAR